MQGNKREFDWALLWIRVKKYLLNKYVVTILIFVFIMLFAGDQSLIHSIRRGREIHQLEKQRDMYREGVQSTLQGINMLQNTDSLERYAREHYYMHASDEDIYLVE